ncbi:cellulase family glycosylhydrolase [Mycolicibacterium grossiae]|uniref:Glycoside hydrolase family 5 domain-containing protein n=1 Tax=Mycolicibacterium grossiae TaxID=1552759 RepID=A0A1E8Q2J3_9MYCO|nr:cellulase family glycosylhydrolase [Mycolicibacterium grossiae]OFJ52471.1 hypothetical protein BEL07_17220 [Mycolicibacterium grossiae]QEM45578.1 cellulase family glycosylhydrolase [Mycolicibacterium grossiae]
MRRPHRRPRRRFATRSLTALAVALLTVAGIWLTPAAPRVVQVVGTARIAPLPTTVGFHDPETYFMSDAQVGAAFDQMVALGVKTVRLMIPWAGVEQTQGQFTWTNVDRTIDAAVARNMAILGIVNATPAWAVVPGAPPITGRPASAAQYAEFCERVAARYQGKVSAYEIWNEPNGSQFFAPTPDPAAYTELLRAAYPRIKAVDARATVIGGVLGSVIDWGTWTVNPVTFLQQMYAAGAHGSFDALSFHPYQYTLKFSEGFPIANSPMNQVIAMRQLMLANGDAGKKIWATEYGEPMTAADEATQAAFIGDLLTKWREMPYAGPIMIHTTRDRNTGSSDPEDVFGVYRSDGSPKPSAQTISDAVADGIPETPEYQRFSQVTDPAYGEVLSPVYRATPSVWAQTRAASTVYETPSGFLASPNAVAERARQYGVVPKAAFANGYQDMDSPSGMRVWWSPTTGAHVVGGGIVEAWTPRLGLATTDEVREGWGVRVTFEHGYITWQPFVGATAYVT